MNDSPDRSTRPGSGRITSWLKREMDAHHVRLAKINDTPHSVALGSAIGMFFGFTPLFGLKTLLSIGTAWISRSNKMAAAITVTLHDVILPFAPVLYYWEYKLGMWVLHGQFPRRHFRHIALRDYMEWTTFFTLGQPMLVGSLFLALPSGFLVYFFLRTLLVRAHLAASSSGFQGAACFQAAAGHLRKRPSLQKRVSGPGSGKFP